MLSRGTVSAALSGICLYAVLAVLALWAAMLLAGFVNTCTGAASPAQIQAGVSRLRHGGV